jgi:hypothetical protein
MIISGCLGKEQAIAPVKYVKRLKEADFPPTAKTLRHLACSVAEKNCFPHRLNRDTRLAGREWLQLFLESHPELTVSKAQVVYITRGLGMCRQKADSYCNHTPSVTDVMLTLDAIPSQGDFTGLDLLLKRTRKRMCKNCVRRCSNDSSAKNFYVHYEIGIDLLECLKAKHFAV